MGQDEIYELLKKRPNLLTREIADILDKNIFHVSRLVNKMVQNGDLISFEPDRQEKRKLLDKYPSLLMASKIYVYKVKDA